MTMPRFIDSSTTVLRLSILAALGLSMSTVSFALTPDVESDTVMMQPNNATNATTAINPPTAELDEIVVTATRSPTKVTNTIAQTQVINAEALKQYQGQSALDVLKSQPGLSHYSNGGHGSKSNFYMRGYDGKQILVLIDGVRYSSITDGVAALHLLPADQIDRIEVLYGASGSSIYGADAMGGVIQIFTKGNSVNQSQVAVTAGVGSHDQYLYGASAQLRSDTGTTLSLSASRNETDGFNATLPDPGNPFSPYNKDKDGFESNNYSLMLSQRLNESLLVGASALYSKSTTQYDDGDYKDAHTDQENGAAQAFIDWRYQPASSLKLQYGHSIDKGNSFAKYGNEFNTTQDQISLVGRHQLAVGQAVYGGEHLKQSLDSTAYSADDRKVTSGFLGYVFGSDTLDAQANVRVDDYSDFDRETTYNLGAAYHLTPSLRVGANYAKGFRAPSFNDLYYPGSGNPNLIPETSDNYEAFVEYDTPLQSTRMTGYRNNVDDLIAYIGKPTTDNPYAGNMENIDKAKIEGISLTSDWFIEDYLLGFSYDYQKALDNSGGSNEGNFLAIRPEHKGLVYVGYQQPSFDIRAEYQYVGDYYYGVANTDSQLVDAYGLVNISGNYRFSPRLSMTARINNLTNKDYVTAPGYKTDGTNFFTSLTYSFD